MSHTFELLAREGVASIRDIQKNPSKALQGITRVVRGSKTIGFFFSNEELEELMEDLEATVSKSLKVRVTQARRELKAGKTVSLETMAKRYGV